MKIDDILRQRIQSKKETITVSFEKKINVKQYETEVLSATASVDIDGDIPSIERVYIESLLSAQLEYSVFAQALFRGFITQTEMTDRSHQIESNMTTLIEKAKAVGVDLSKYLE